jgi:hypothetical protein
LFYDVEVHLFDVWDNRQFPAFQQYFREFSTVVDRSIPMTNGEKEDVHGLLDTLLKATAFEEVYAL